MGAPTTVRSATRRLVGLTALRWLPVGPHHADHRPARPVAGPLAGRDRGCCSPCTASSSSRSSCRPAGWPTCSAAAPSSSPAPCCTWSPASSTRPRPAADRLRPRRGCCSGIGRALDSGPVEAWYVEAVHRIDPAADVAPGLARHAARLTAAVWPSGPSSADCCPALLTGRRSALAVPFVVAAVLDLVVRRRRRAAAHRGATAAGGQRGAERSSRGPGRCRRPSPGRSGCRSPTGRCGWCCC